MKLEINIVRSVAFFADTHVGSPYALNFWEKLKTSKATYYTPDCMNEGQREIVDNYHYSLAMCDKFEVDTVVLLGDLFDGYNPGVLNTDLQIAGISAQQAVCEEVLKPLIGGGDGERDVHVTCGSRWHESKEYSVYSSLARNFEEYTDGDVYFHEVLGNVKFRPSDKLFNIAHEATSAMLYTATILDREHIYAKYAEGMGKLPRIDYMVRAHIHKFYHIDTGHMHVLLTPCWKAWYPIKNKTTLYGRHQTDIGFTIVLIDEDDRTYLKNFVWNAPLIHDAVVNA